MPPTSSNRFCPVCETRWPNDIVEFGTCPVCKCGTVYDGKAPSQFDNVVKARRRAEFETYYLEVHIPAGANKVVEAIKASGRMTPAELAAEFAKLCSSATKEDSYGTE